MAKRIKILSVHPTVTIAETNGQTIEIPTDWFPSRPETGQNWSLDLSSERNDADRFAELNRLIG